jgi:hypothetical protein
VLHRETPKPRRLQALKQVSARHRWARTLLRAAVASVSQSVRIRAAHGRCGRGNERGSPCCWRSASSAGAARSSGGRSSGAATPSRCASTRTSRCEACASARDMRGPNCTTYWDPPPKCPPPRRLRPELSKRWRSCTPAPPCCAGLLYGLQGVMGSTEVRARPGPSGRVPSKGWPWRRDGARPHVAATDSLLRASQWVLRPARRDKVGLSVCLQVPTWKVVFPEKLVQFRPVDGLRADLFSVVGLAGQP